MRAALTDDAEVAYAADLWTFEVRRAASRADGEPRAMTSRFAIDAIASDVERGLLFVKGSVPGHKGSWLTVKDSVKIARNENAPYPAGLRTAAAAPQNNDAQVTDNAPATDSTEG